MAQTERIREVLRTAPDPNYFNERTAAGWRLVAVEWEREGETDEQESGRRREDVPFGLRVAHDCQHLEEDPAEMEALRLMMELVVQDISFPHMADELNRRGYRTRDGFKWDLVSVFNMLPRVIEVGPRILHSEQWLDRRKQLPKIAWNS